MSPRLWWWWCCKEASSQYLTGTTGYVKSFNYDSGIHLADQQYTVCIRAELGYCSISWASVSTTSFQLSGPAPASTQTATQGDTCTTDYIILQSAGASLPPTPAAGRTDRFCGGILAGQTEPSGTVGTVYTQKLPFNMFVNFDGTESDESATENSVGFSLYYAQSACT